MIRLSHWLLACLLALMIHGGVAWAVLTGEEETKGAKALGTGGFEVSITMVAAAMGVEEASKEQLTEQVLEKVKPEEIVEPEPEPVVDQIELPVLEKVVENDRPSELIEKKKPEPIKKVVAKEKPKVVPKPKSKPVVKKIAKKPQPKPVEQPAEKSSKEVAMRVSQGVATTGPLANRSDATTRQGGGKIVGKAKPDYITKLRMWLEQHKTYPKKAKRRRQQGVVMLAFSMRRDGSVMESSIRQGSGVKSLDKETIAMLKRAQPLPKFPDEMDGDVLKLVVPVEFSLKR